MINYTLIKNSDMIYVDFFTKRMWLSLILGLLTFAAICFVAGLKLAILFAALDAASTIVKVIVDMSCRAVDEARAYSKLVDDAAEYANHVCGHPTSENECQVWEEACRFYRKCKVYHEAKAIFRTITQQRSDL